MIMNLDTFIKKIIANESVTFSETMAIIDEHFQYQASQFHNGLGKDRLTNTAGTNEGSCKIFAFARLQQLDKLQTLALFGDYYRLDVLSNPEGNDHQNIRNFIKYGWDGITFDQEPLSR